MKKILLFLMLIAALASMNTAKAQCDLKIANMVITKVGDATPAGSDCSYTFNASFDIVTNSGFKYLFFHSWKTENYPSPSIFDCTKLNSAQDPGTALQLGTARNTFGKSFLDLGFIGLQDLTIGASQIDVTNKIATVYPHDNSVELVTPTNSPGINAKVNRRNGDTLHFEITNINVLVYGGCAPVNVKTDIWGSNANSGDPKAQCFICGLSQIINNPSLSLVKNCAASPFSFTLGILTGPGNSLNVVYRIYADADLDNVREPGTAEDALLVTSGPLTLAPNTQYTYGPTVLPWPWCCSELYSSAGLYAVVSVEGFSSGVGTQIASNDCATLPIKLKSFNAERNRSNVDVRWETEVEVNNKGFYLERKLSNGGWQDITFVSSKANNGTSNSSLVYDFTDPNNAKGISQYRLRQVDIDGKQTYSQIRSVRGEGQKSNTIIYPNPSGDGKVSVVFEDANSVRDVSLMDVSGKTLKQWKGVTNNTIQIDNLNSGFYTVRIVNIETGEQVVEKFIVNKR
jgi:hypothetical protein